MGLLTSWLGKLGPFYHNSEETYPDGSAMRSGRFEGPVRIDGAPSADTDAVRLLELNAAKSALVRPVAVADIDDPSTELAAYAGSRALPYLSAYEAVDGGDDKVTLYVWKEDYASGASAPYVVAGTGGFWVAIGGEYALAGSITADAFFADSITADDLLQGAGQRRVENRLFEFQTVNNTPVTFHTIASADVIGAVFIDLRIARMSSSGLAYDYNSYLSLFKKSVALEKDDANGPAVLYGSVLTVAATTDGNTISIKATGEAAETNQWTIQARLIFV